MYKNKKYHLSVVNLNKEAIILLKHMALAAARNAKYSVAMARSSNFSLASIMFNSKA